MKKSVNILIHGLNSKTGGGKNIFDNYINQLFINDLDCKYFILAPDDKNYQKFENSNIKILKIFNIFRANLLFPLLYYLVIPRLLSKLKIDLVLNFGDLIYPTRKPQIYFFDWAYAVYSDDYIWKKMEIKDYLLRLIKQMQINRHIQNTDLILAQTDNMADRLRKKYGLNNIKILPTPVSRDFIKLSSKNKIKLDKGFTNFLYPASLSPHKNFEILKPLALKILSRNLTFKIIITLEEESSSQFIKSINEYLGSVIINVGHLTQTQIPALYKACDALFFLKPFRIIWFTLY